eukprot:TRINITY_DN5530_c1_g1_i1.p2 TRINITY_DN5530_c1_g1~~TRINITY_DN5530_c1_g1_i1.p2  ORF type:complete len:114 (+),score=7.67 TRINITY_DN5530_c1_g1_i1:362-703(+)
MLDPPPWLLGPQIATVAAYTASDNSPTQRKINCLLLFLPISWGSWWLLIAVAPSSFHYHLRSHQIDRSSSRGSMMKRKRVECRSLPPSLCVIACMGAVASQTSIVHHAWNSCF